MSSFISGMSSRLVTGTFCYRKSTLKQQSKDSQLAGFCFSLTGVSPFAGENDRATTLNIRNYNVAFEESMFSDLCKEAKGFVIKLLVVDRL